MKKVYAIVLAAGSGSRMGGEVAKQYQLLGQKPVIAHTLTAFEQSVADAVVLVVSEEAAGYVQEEIVEKYGFQKVRAVVPGGSTRCDSVYAGMRHIMEECLAADDLVLVHDGARPYVSRELIEKMADAAEKEGAAVPAVPVKDTIKQVKDGFVAGTPDRAGLYAVQTPQAFRAGLLWEAFEKYKKTAAEGRELSEITDDAVLVERMMGKKIAVIEGDYHNIKLTTPEDLLFARMLLQEMENQS